MPAPRKPLNPQKYDERIDTLVRSILKNTTARKEDPEGCKIDMNRAILREVLRQRMPSGTTIGFPAAARNQDYYKPKARPKVSFREEQEEDSWSDIEDETYVERETGKRCQASKSIIMLKFPTEEMQYSKTSLKSNSVASDNHMSKAGYGKQTLPLDKLRRWHMYRGEFSMSRERLKRTSSVTLEDLRKLADKKAAAKGVEASRAKAGAGAKPKENVNKIKQAAEKQIRSKEGVEKAKLDAAKSKGATKPKPKAKEPTQMAAKKTKKVSFVTKTAAESAETAKPTALKKLKGKTTTKHKKLAVKIKIEPVDTTSIPKSALKAGQETAMPKSKSSEQQSKPKQTAARRNNPEIEKELSSMIATPSSLPVTQDELQRAAAYAAETSHARRDIDYRTYISRKIKTVTGTNLPQTIWKKDKRGAVQASFGADKGTVNVVYYPPIRCNNRYLYQ